LSPAFSRGLTPDQTICEPITFPKLTDRHLDILMAYWEAVIAKQRTEEPATKNEEPDRLQNRLVAPPEESKRRG
jgi:hypothetical protein